MGSGLHATVNSLMNVSMRTINMDVHYFTKLKRKLIHWVMYPRRVNPSMILPNMVL